MWDRESVETLKGWERPSVRCKHDCEYIDQDGHKTHGVKETTGQIALDGNNPWVVIFAGGKHHEFRVSWGLVLEVLNDRFASPIWFPQVVQYEV